MPAPFRYPHPGEIDPPRDAANVTRAYLEHEVGRLAALMPAIGKVLEGVSLDVTDTRLHADLVLLASYAKDGKTPEGLEPPDLPGVGAALVRTLAALDGAPVLDVDAEGVPTGFGGMILRVAGVRLALELGKPVSSADLATCAGLSASRVRALAAGDPKQLGARMERDPGSSRCYTAASALRFLRARDVPGF